MPEQISSTEEEGSTERTSHSSLQQCNPLRIAKEGVSSTSTLMDGEYITSESEYEKTVHKLGKISHRYSLVVQNWLVEL